MRIIVERDEKMNLRSKMLCVSLSWYTDGDGEREGACGLYSEGEDEIIKVLVRLQTDFLFSAEFRSFVPVLIFEWAERAV